MEEAALPAFFGEWLKIRRKELDLTQAELAVRAGCSLPALRKIESGDRRPSKQLAGLLAQSLEIPTEEQSNFIRAARGELSMDRFLTAALAPVRLFERDPPSCPPTGNLPKKLTPFIGREPELAALSQLLQDPQCRMLTIVGSGGIGKTHLAVEVACRNKELFPDGVWFVPLAPLVSPEYLVPAIADALDFCCHGLTNPRSNLIHYLHDKHTLLILDNCEHLLDGVELFTDILENSSQVTLLATSRERLNLLSEWVFEIQGLPVPPSDQLDQYEGYSSVALFLQHARRLQAGTPIREIDRQWVVRICQIMEGMPLGIELAASWAGMLSFEEIAAESERNLDFLSASMLDLPERHRSLRAVINQSWNLLDSEEKLILSRLSVFVGSFSLEAAGKVCGTSLRILSALKDKSLLRRLDRGRYDLHELIHQYAALRLAEDPHEEEQAKDAHALFYARRHAEWETAFKSSRQIDTLTEIAHEIDNLRQAWQRMVACCLSDCQSNTLFDLSLFRSSMFSLSLFYEMRCRNVEAISLFGGALNDLVSENGALEISDKNQYFKTELGLIKAQLGLHHAYIMRYRQACEILKEADDLLRDDDSMLDNAQAQVTFAWILQIQGQFQKSADLLIKIRQIFQGANEVWWYAMTLNHLGWAYLALGNIQESLLLFKEAIQLIDPRDLRQAIPIRNGLARVFYLQADYLAAEKLLKETLDLSFELGSKRQTAFCYLDLGQVALATGKIELAQQYFQESINLNCEFGESHDLALGFIYSGKCLMNTSEKDAARSKFLKVVHIGRSLDIFFLVYWGLVNIANVHLLENRLEDALEIAIILQRCPVEFKIAQHDYLDLMEALQARLPPLQFETARKQTKDMSIETLLNQMDMDLFPITYNQDPFPS